MAEQNPSEYETRTPDQNRVHEIEKRQRETEAVRKLRGRVPRDMTKAVDERERRGQNEVDALEKSHREAHADEELRDEAASRNQLGDAEDNPLAGMMDGPTGDTPNRPAPPEQFDNMLPPSGRGVIQTRHWTDDAPRAIDRIPWIDKNAERIGNSPIGQPDSETRVMVTGAWDYKHQDAVYKALDHILDRCRGDLVIITGAAGYAERNAKMWARHNDVKHEQYSRLELGDEPGESTERSADRNQRMLLDATPHLVVAFPSHDEKPSRNAKLLALWAAENGVPVEVAAVNGRTYSHSEARTDSYEPPTRETAEMTYGFSELPSIADEQDGPEPETNGRPRSQNSVMDLMGNLPGSTESAPEEPDSPKHEDDEPELDIEDDDLKLDAHAPNEDNEAPEPHRYKPAGGNSPVDLSGMMSAPEPDAAPPPEARPVRGGQVKASATHVPAAHHPVPDNSRKSGNGKR